MKNLVKEHRKFQQDHFSLYEPSSKHIDYWLLSLAGEIGEACNVWKKIERFRRFGKLVKKDANISKKDLVDEVADIMISLLGLAECLDIDLQEITLKKMDRNRE